MTGELSHNKSSELFPGFFSLRVAQFTSIFVTQEQSLTSLHFLCHTFLNLFLKVLYLFMCVYMHVSAWVYLHMCVQMSSETRKRYLELQLWVSVNCTLGCCHASSGSQVLVTEHQRSWLLSHLPSPINAVQEGSDQTNVMVFKLLIKSRHWDTCIRKALCCLPFQLSWQQLESKTHKTDCGPPRMV